MRVYALPLLVIMFGCADRTPPPVPKCSDQRQCQGEQLCYCEPETFSESDAKCLNPDDLPAGTCVSRQEFMRREGPACQKVGKPSDCLRNPPTPQQQMEQARKDLAERERALADLNQRISEATSEDEKAKLKAERETLERKTKVNLDATCIDNPLGCN